MKKVLLALVIVALACGQASAALVYWDINGATAGAGAAVATGNWDTATANWSSATAGNVATQTWNNANGDTAVLAAGTDASGTYTITLTAPISMAGITREEGTPTVSGVAANPITFSTGTLAIDSGTGTLAVSAFFATTNGTITKAGTGIGTFGTTQSTFAGKWIGNAGSLSFPGDGRIGVVPGALVPDQITLNNGAKLRSSTAGASFNANRGITLGPGGGGFDQTIAITWNGPIAGTSGGTLTQVGAGTTNLTAVNSYDGGTTIPTGVISIDGDATLGNGVGTLTLSGGKLDIAANRSVSANPVPNPINLTANSVISTSSTAGTVNLNLSSNTVGGTGGTLTFRNEATAGTGVFDPRFSGNGFNMTRPIVLAAGSIDVNRTVRLSSFNLSATTQTFSGIISGSGSYRRSSGTAGTGGTTIFSADNTYSGGTEVNDGTLLANNPDTVSGSATGSGPVTILANGTLGGTGRVAGAVSSGGAIAPGASIGTLSIANTVVLNPASKLVYELTLTGSGQQPVGGTSNDLLEDVTALTLGDATTGAILDVINSSGIAAAQAGDRWTLITYTPGNLTVAGPGLVVGSIPTLTDTSLAYGIDLSVAGEVALLVVTQAVPEAGSFAAVGLVGLLSVGAVWIRRRMRPATIAA